MAPNPHVQIKPHKPLQERFPKETNNLLSLSQKNFTGYYYGYLNGTFVSDDSSYDNSTSKNSTDYSYGYGSDSYGSSGYKSYGSGNYGSSGYNSYGSGSYGSSGYNTCVSGS